MERKVASMNPQITCPQCRGQSQLHPNNSHQYVNCPHCQATIDAFQQTGAPANGNAMPSTPIAPQPPQISLPQKPLGQGPVPYSAGPAGVAVAPTKSSNSWLWILLILFGLFLVFTLVLGILAYTIFASAGRDRPAEKKFSSNEAREAIWQSANEKSFPDRQWNSEVTDTQERERAEMERIQQEQTNALERFHDLVKQNEKENQETQVPNREPGEYTIEQLAKDLRSSEYREKSRAEEALQNAEFQPPNDEVSQALLDTFADRTKSHDTSYLVKWLSVEEDAPKLLEMVKSTDSSYSVKKLALDVLVEMQYEPTVSVIFDYLKDPGSSFSSTAARYFPKFGELAANELAEYIRSGDLEMRSIARLVRVMVELDSEAVKDALREKADSLGERDLEKRLLESLLQRLDRGNSSD